MVEIMYSPSQLVDRIEASDSDTICFYDLRDERLCSERDIFIHRARNHRNAPLSTTCKLVRALGGADGHTHMEGIHGKCSV
jgi:hypothetical protein